MVRSLPESNFKNPLNDGPINLEPAWVRSDQVSFLGLPTENDVVIIKNFDEICTFINTVKSHSILKRLDGPKISSCLHSCQPAVFGGFYCKLFGLTEPDRICLKISGSCPTWKLILRVRSNSNRIQVQVRLGLNGSTWSQNRNAWFRSSADWTWNLSSGSGQIRFVSRSGSGQPEPVSSLKNNVKICIGYMQYGSLQILLRSVSVSLFCNQMTHFNTVVSVSSKRNGINQKFPISTYNILQKSIFS